MTDGSLIVTSSGRLLDVFAPDPRSFDIADIALGLSREGRWANQTRWPYSVAQHSVLVSQVCPTLQALFHDAHETYLRDMPLPIKSHPAFTFYREVEDRLMAAVLRWIGAPEVLTAAVHDADESVRLREAQILMPSSGLWDTLDFSRAAQVEIVPWTPQESERRFLDRYLELTPPAARRWEE
jgi:hypothetical protein